MLMRSRYGVLPTLVPYLSLSKHALLTPKFPSFVVSLSLPLITSILQQKTIPSLLGYLSSSSTRVLYHVWASNLLSFLFYAPEEYFLLIPHSDEKAVLPCQRLMQVTRPLEPGPSAF